MALKSIRGRTTIIGPAIEQQTPINLDPITYEGSIVYGDDGVFRGSNGTSWNTIGTGGGVQGPQGVQGTQGTQGIQGDYGPSINVIGSVADVNVIGDPQQTLNNAFPAAIAGDGVVDEATGDFWVYDGTSWSNTGNISGPTGPQGPQGLKGDQGNSGVQGVRGFRGPQGIQGIIGSQGVQGNLGFTGPQGLQGISGEAVAQGLQGTQGFDGPPGVGAQGSQGVGGVQGLQGFVGAQGLQGFSGAAVSQGLQGPQGLSGEVSGQGVQGAQGISGSAVLQGLQGAQGLQGFAGLAVAQGTQGVQGAQGFTGAAVAQGIQGLQGLQGLSGEALAQGLQGPQGPQGIQGFDGQAGAIGVLNETVSSSDFYPSLTDTSSGGVSQIYVSDQKLKFVPSTGLLFANQMKSNSYREKSIIETSPGTNYTVNCSAGNIFDIAMNSNLTIGFSNVPPLGDGFVLVLKITQGGGFTINWPSSVKFSDGVAPTLSSGSSEIDVFTLVTFDGGTNWYLFISGQDLK